jgi:hypothetical protein
MNSFLLPDRFPWRLFRHFDLETLLLPGPPSYYFRRANSLDSKRHLGRASTAFHNAHIQAKQYSKRNFVLFQGCPSLAVDEGILRCSMLRLHVNPGGHRVM